VLGTHSHLTTMHFLAWARRLEPGSLPADPEAMKQLMIYFDKVRGAQRRRQIIDDDFRRTVVTIFLEHANYRDTARLMDDVRVYVETHLATRGAHLDFAGDVAVSQAMIPAIVRTQIGSVVLALAGALLSLSLLLRSIRLGLLAALPAVIAALWILGAMGWLGIPLGVATSMFCAITLGIGVDYGIHFLEGVRRARRAGRPDPVGHAVGAVGPAIGIDTLAIGLGFGLLVVSSVPANARLGLLVALALGAGAVLTLAGLGALLSPARPLD
jgi:predicted RND superfamily exporter protein